MPLSVFDLNPLLNIRATNWRKSGGVIYQRGTFTAGTRALRIGPAARWQCTISFPPTIDQEALRLMRGFQATFSQPDIAFRLPIVDVPQITTGGWPTFCRVLGGGQAGQTLLVDGLPASQTVLRNGQMISVALAGDDDQPFILRNDMVSNGAGEATLVLDEPLRRSPPDNAVVQIHLPASIMRLRDGVGWNSSPGLLNEFPDLQAEEAF